MRLNSPKIISPNFFGFAEHGNFESKDTTTYLDVPDNQGPCYYFFNNFIVNAGHTVTTNKPCKGLYIYVANEAIINGTITMTNRGVYSPPEGEYKNGYTPLGLNNVIGVNFNSDISLPGNNNLALATKPGINGGCGGGGNGGRSSYITQGGCAGVFSSGSGGGAVISHSRGTIYAGNAQDYGGKGGLGYRYSSCSKTYNAAGGRGNPRPIYTTVDNNSGWYYLDSSSSDGAGCLYLISRSLIFSPTGILTSEGISETTSNYSVGCNDGWGNASWYSGGATGGGSITVLYTYLHNIINYSVNNAKNYNSLVSGIGSFRSYQIL